VETDIPCKKCYGEPVFFDKSKDSYQLKNKADLT